MFGTEILFFSFLRGLTGKVLNNEKEREDRMFHSLQVTN